MPPRLIVWVRVKNLSDSLQSRRKSPRSSHSPTWNPRIQQKSSWKFGQNGQKKEMMKILSFKSISLTVFKHFNCILTPFYCLIETYHFTDVTSWCSDWISWNRESQEEKNVFVFESFVFVLKQVIGAYFIYFFCWNWFLIIKCITKIAQNLDFNFILLSQFVQEFLALSWCIIWIFPEISMVF